MGGSPLLADNPRKMAHRFLRIAAETLAPVSHCLPGAHPPGRPRCRRRSPSCRPAASWLGGLLCIDGCGSPGVAAAGSTGLFMRVHVEAKSAPGSVQCCTAGRAASDLDTRRPAAASARFFLQGDSFVGFDKQPGGALSGDQSFEGFFGPVDFYGPLSGQSADDFAAMAANGTLYVNVHTLQVHRNRVRVATPCCPARPRHDALPAARGLRLGPPACKLHLPRAVLF